MNPAVPYCLEWNQDFSKCFCQVMSQLTPVLFLRCRSVETLDFCVLSHRCRGRLRSLKNRIGGRVGAVCSSSSAVVTTVYDSDPHAKEEVSVSFQKNDCNCLSLILCERGLMVYLVQITVRIAQVRHSSYNSFHLRLSYSSSSTEAKE